MKIMGMLDTSNPPYAWEVGMVADEYVFPEGFIEILVPRPLESVVPDANWMMYNSATSVWEIPYHIGASMFRTWRTTQFNTWVDSGYMLVVDGNHKAQGTLQDWKDFKNALRDHPEHPNFPDPAYRPVFVNSLEVPEDPEEE